MFTVADAARTDAMRHRMLAVQDDLVKQWRNTSAIAAQALTGAGAR